MRMSDLERFYSYCEPVTESGCLIWTGGTKGHGYGAFYYRGKTLRAHKWLYETVLHAVNEGMQLDHLCRVRCCVNLTHLEEVTSRDNVLRGIGPSAQNFRKTHCIHGHELKGENLRINPRNGKRVCRECNKIRKMEFNARKNAKTK